MLNILTFLQIIMIEVLISNVTYRLLFLLRSKASIDLSKSMIKTAGQRSRVSTVSRSLCEPPILDDLINTGCLSIALFRNHRRTRCRPATGH
jgi:hypothetical protein